MWSCIHIYAIAQNKSQRNLIFSEYYLKHAKIEKEEKKTSTDKDEDEEKRKRRSRWNSSFRRDADAAITKI